MEWKEEWKEEMLKEIANLGINIDEVKQSLEKTFGSLSEEKQKQFVEEFMKRSEILAKIRETFEERLKEKGVYIFRLSL